MNGRFCASTTAKLAGSCYPAIPAYSYEADTGTNSEFRAMQVKYACINIPQPARDALVKKHLPSLNSDFGRQLKRLFKELHQIARFRRHATRGSTFTFEFEFRNEPHN